jgi:hypothetical protein
MGEAVSWFILGFGGIGFRRMGSGFVSGGTRFGSIQKPSLGGRRLWRRESLLVEVSNVCVLSILCAAKAHCVRVFIKIVVG